MRAPWSLNDPPPRPPRRHGPRLRPDAGAVLLGGEDRDHRREHLRLPAAPPAARPPPLQFRGCLVPHPVPALPAEQPDRLGAGGGRQPRAERDGGIRAHAAISRAALGAAAAALLYADPVP